MRNINDVAPLVIGLGVQKAATTWLHRQLESHPEIAATYTKEVGYWLRNYNKGPDWYRRQFNKTPSTRVYVEYTPSYFSNIDLVLTRICTDARNARFLLTLRNPYDRAFSLYLEKYRNGETRLSFRDACKQDSQIINSGCYATGIELFLNYFDRNRMHIMRFDDIENKPLTVLRELYIYMGVDSSFVPNSLTRKVNAGRGISRADLMLKKLEVIVKRCGLERRHLVKFGVGNLMDWYKLYLSRRHPKPKTPTSEIDYLDTYFREDILRLERLVHKDFSSWLPAR